MGISGEVVLKITIGFQTDVMSSDEACDGGLNKRFPMLCEFSGGLIWTYAGTARVESDLSIPGVKNNALPNVLDEHLARWHHARKAVNGVAGIGYLFELDIMNVA